MPIHKPRSRIVSFRLSDEEYESLRKLSFANGARSVSEYTRSMAFQKSSPSDLNETIETLEHKIQHLTELLEKKQ